MHHRTITNTDDLSIRVENLDHLVTSEGISLKGDPSFIKEAEVVVGIAFHNQGRTLLRCIESAMRQVTSYKVAFLILDDASDEDVFPSVRAVVDRRFVFGKVSYRAPWRTRNTILDLVDRYFTRASWVARLDADDCFSEQASLETACRLAENAGAKFVLGGNRLLAAGQLLPKTNPARQELLNRDYVLELLARMAAGVAENELPSCNLVLAAGAGWRYPDVPSAEDHWLVAELLCRHARAGAILETPFYCDYSLTGNVSSENRRGETYLRSRTELYRKAQQWVGR